MLASSKESPWFRWIYEPYTRGQVKWYEWAVRGLATRYGMANPSELRSTLLLHKPLPVFYQAWNTASGTPNHIWGENREGIWSADYDNGFWQAVRSLGSTRYIIAGHDHINNFKIYYEGVRMSYAIASNRNVAVLGGYGQIAGGLVLTVNLDGSVTQEKIIRQRDGSLLMAGAGSS